jgi:DNA-binding NarL/FixJ family response regulator
VKASQTKPHVIIMDVGLQGFKESSVVESIRNIMPEARVIGMGFIPSQSNVAELVETGISVFILKDATVKEFLGTVRSVAKEENIIPPSLTGSLFSHIAELTLKKRKGNITNAEAKRIGNVKSLNGLPIV